MSTPARLSYLQTLISLYSSRLLDEVQFEQLIAQPIETGINVLDAAHLTALKQQLIANNYQPMASGELENLIMFGLVEEAKNITRSLTDVEHELFLYWLKRLEIINIKIILRGKSIQTSSATIRHELVQLGSLATLPIEELLHAEDVSEFLRLLEQTSYAAIARYTRDNFKENQEIFNLETSVDRQYFIGLNTRIKMINRNEQQRLHSLIGLIIDQMNTMWLLRYRLIYKLSPSHIYFLLSSGGRYLHQHELMKLSQIENFDQFFDSLPLSLQQLLQDADSFNTIEIRLEREIIKHAKSLLKDVRFSLTSVFAYLFLREKQLFRIHAALKGKVLRLNESHIRFATGTF